VISSWLLEELNIPHEMLERVGKDFLTVWLLLSVMRPSISANMCLIIGYTETPGEEGKVRTKESGTQKLTRQKGSSQ
jgi:hypothetical protein